MSVSPVPLSMRAWFPDLETMWSELAIERSIEQNLRDDAISAWRGMAFTWKSGNWESHWFSGSCWSAWTSRNWAIPLTAVVLYMVAIPSLKWLVAKHGKWNVRNFAFYWNAGLSVFSGCGVVACVPVLLGSFLEHGLYFTSCAPVAWYGTGTSGFFVALFIYSKIAELVDTILLVLAQKPVIALQWWHHSTVLLYCWHSYSVRIATGLWFAAMNYSVHFVMYGYFALMATQWRKFITPYAVFITLAQLLQMLVGMFVTVRAVLFQVDGKECHVNRTNSVLGLLMYLSYFVLFFKLFVDNYVTQTRKRCPADGLPAKRKSSLREVTRDISRTLTATAVPHLDFDDDEVVARKKNH